MKKTLKILISIFLVIIFVFLITGCSKYSLSNFGLGTKEAAANIESTNKTTQEIPSEEKPGAFCSINNQDNDTSISNSGSDNTADSNDAIDSSEESNDEGNTSTTIEETGSKQETANTLPQLYLEVIEGPVILEDNSLCYYRIKANAQGSPRPKINFSKDDSSGAWGENIVQINLAPDETYELTVKASNSSGQAYASVIVNWNESSIKTGQTKIISDEANPANYLIDVNLIEQKVRVFYKGSLLKEMICSSGAPLTPTPKGTFKTTDKIKYAWLAEYNVGAYYFVRFYGSYLFHSVPVDKQGNLIEEDYQNLGVPVSHGCIRIDFDEEKWLYETVPSGVTVNIY